MNWCRRWSPLAPVAFIVKVLEDAAELRAANTPQERLGEAADVREILAAVAELADFTHADAIHAAGQKRTERGAFRDRI